MHRKRQQPVTRNFCCLFLLLMFFILLFLAQKSIEFSIVVSRNCTDCNGIFEGDYANLDSLEDGFFDHKIGSGQSCMYSNIDHATSCLKATYQCNDLKGDKNPIMVLRHSKNGMLEKIKLEKTKNKLEFECKNGSWYLLNSHKEFPPFTGELYCLSPCLSNNCSNPTQNNNCIDEFNRLESYTTKTTFPKITTTTTKPELRAIECGTSCPNILDSDISKDLYLAYAYTQGSSCIEQYIDQNTGCLMTKYSCGNKNMDKWEVRVAGLMKDANSYMEYFETIKLYNPWNQYSHRSSSFIEVDLICGIDGYWYSTTNSNGSILSMHPYNHRYAYNNGRSYTRAKPYTGELLCAITCDGYKCPERDPNFCMTVNDTQVVEPPKTCKSCPPLYNDFEKHLFGPYYDKDMRNEGSTCIQRYEDPQTGCLKTTYTCGYGEQLVVNMADYALEQGVYSVPEVRMYGYAWNGYQYVDDLISTVYYGKKAKQEFTCGDDGKWYLSNEFSSGQAQNSYTSLVCAIRCDNHTICSNPDPNFCNKL